MERLTKIHRNKYARVMSRVTNRSKTNLGADSIVMRHELPSARLRGKLTHSNPNCGVFSELPTVLNDYTPETVPDRVLRRTLTSKPRKTIKSLDPATSPHRVIAKCETGRKPRPMVKLRESAPVLTNKCMDTNERRCSSSRTHTNLKYLKEEIKAYNEAEKLMRLRSSLYKKCGVVLDDIGQVTEDKAIQVEPAPDTGNPKR